MAIIVETAGFGSVRATWQHAHQREGKRITHYQTRCQLDDAYGNKRASVAMCHPNDNYSKNTGRKVSLHKVLMKAMPGKENKADRRLFWEAYKQMRNGKGW